MTSSRNPKLIYCNVRLYRSPRGLPYNKEKLSGLKDTPTQKKLTCPAYKKSKDFPVRLKSIPNPPPKNQRASITSLYGP